MFLISPIAKAAFVVFILFFLFGLLFWLKTWFEINKFRKLKKIKKDLLLLRSPFYLNRLSEIRKLSFRNSDYNQIFFTFFWKYETYFAKELELIFVNLLKFMKKKEEFKNFLLESNDFTIFIKEYDILNNKIESFANELRFFASWESFCLGKVNELNMIMDKVYEEIERMKITFSFNFFEFEKRLNELQHQIGDFNDLIYQKNYFKTFSFFRELEKKIIVFLSETYDWIKVINIFFIFLPKQRQKLNDLLPTSFAKDKLLNYFQKETLSLENFLSNWEIEKAKNLTLFLLVDINNKIYELENRDTLIIIFKNSLQTSTESFEKTKKNIFDLLYLSKSSAKKDLFQRFGEVGFENFNDLIQKNQKILDDLFVKSQTIKNILFFKPLLKKINELLKALTVLFEVYNRMKHFFTRESEQIEKIILAFFNLNTLFSKNSNFFLKNIFQKKLDDCIDFFINFEEQKYKPNSTLNYTVLLNTLQGQILNLKINVQNAILLKHIAEFLFVKFNRLRFQNSANWNKILNCEILFLKQQYQNVIEIFFEIIE